MTSDVLSNSIEASPVTSETAAHFAAADRVVPTLRLLADPARMRILQILREGERNVSRLCDLLGLSQPTVSHHLGLLRTAGLLKTRRSGKEVFYALDEAQVVVDPGNGHLRVRSDGLEVRVAGAEPV